MDAARDAAAQVLYHLIGGRDGRCDYDIVHHLAPSDALDKALEHRRACKRQHHLARKPCRRHARFDGGDDFLSVQLTGTARKTRGGLAHRISQDRINGLRQRNNSPVAPENGGQAKIELSDQAMPSGQHLALVEAARINGDDCAALPREFNDVLSAEGTRNIAVRIRT